MTRQKLIQAFPALDLRQAFTLARHDDPILVTNKVRLYASGRAGLFHIIKSLAFPAESVILVPSYHCGVEVEAVLRAGCKVDFYRIHEDLSIDQDSICKKITPNTKGILVAHYFGFPQELSNLKQICQRRDLVLIEDCAHALYSKNEQGDWLGTKGDYALFSMRKTVFMPNGGAVRVNRNGFVLPDKGKHHFDLSILKSTIRSALEHENCMNGSLANLSQWLLDLYQKQTQHNNHASEVTHDDNQCWYYDVATFGYEHGISAISRVCAKNIHYREIIARRRANYESLEKLLAPYLADQFVIPKLAQGVCPLCFPLFVNQRDKVVATLTEHNVFPFVFGRHHHPLLDTAAFPESRLLSDSILGLPVHQQLTEQDLSRVAETVCKILER